MAKHLLTIQEVLGLYSKARKENKILLIKLIHKGKGLPPWFSNFDGLFYGNKLSQDSGRNYCCVNLLAGDWEPHHIAKDFRIVRGSSDEWKIFQANKNDLLCYLDKPVDLETIKKILNGTLEVLE
jgi:hypothetical protein